MTKYLLSTTLLLSLLLLGCNNEEDILREVKIDNLLGSWEWNATSVNGISSSVVPCCVILAFESKDFSKLNGQFTVTENGFSGVGYFEVALETSQLTTTIDDQSRTFTFKLSETMLTLTYEENGDDVIDGYKKTN